MSRSINDLWVPNNQLIMARTWVPNNQLTTSANNRLMSKQSADQTISWLHTPNCAFHLFRGFFTLFRDALGAGMGGQRGRVDAQRDFSIRGCRFWLSLGNPWGKLILLWHISLSKYARKLWRSELFRELYNSCYSPMIAQLLQVLTASRIYLWKVVSQPGTA